MITVRDLLREIDVVPLTGESGLDAPIRWVHITELEDPTPWLTGGELLLTTGIHLKTQQKQEKFVEKIAHYGLAGLGVGTGFELQEVPETMIATAANIDFPIFEIPYSKPFIEITERVSSLLVDDQYALLDRSLTAQERLMSILVTRRGSGVLADALTALVGGTVVMLEKSGEVIFARRFRRPLDQELQEYLGQEIRQRVEAGLPIQPFVPASEELATRTLILPVGSPELSAHVEDTMVFEEKWLAVIKDGGGFSEFDRMVLRQAALIFALDFFASDIEQTQQQDYGLETLRQILSGRLRGDEMGRRLHALGFVDEISALFLKPLSGTLTAKQVRQVSEQLQLSLQEVVSAFVVLPAENGVFVLAGKLPSDWLEGEGDSVVNRLAQDCELSLCLGEGITVYADRAHEALITARFATNVNTFKVAHQVGQEQPAARGFAASYRGLGIFSVLVESAQAGHLRHFCEVTLAPIETENKRYRGQLIRSLDAFLATGGHWEKATDLIGCHRHTLRYRMKKVESITGRDLTSMQDCAELWLALRGRELLQAL